MSPKIIAIVGAYRNGQTIDSAVDELLCSAQSLGAKTRKIYLLDKNVEFCTNCRKCLQNNIIGLRDKCIHNDDMEQILEDVDTADCIVFASPINWFNVTAIMKRFIERLTCYGYWPWGANVIPKNRIKKLTKKAVLITSSSCPEFLGRIFFAGTFKILKAAANCVGAKVVKKIYIGSAAITPDQKLSGKYKKQLIAAGKLLSI